MSISYKDSGVDLEAAEASTKRIAAMAKSTFGSQVLHEIGLFSGFYALDIQKYNEPVLVSSVDGVGTKLKIAFAMDIHDTVGQDLVNHCVNDIMVCGADPLFFLDYIGTLNLTPDKAELLVKGMATACKANNCALVGGETAEMPGFYTSGEYDLVGSIVGVINRSDIIDGRDIGPGNVLLGLPSNGLHTNGYSLARKILLDHKKVDLNKPVPELDGQNWGQALLRVHKSYADAIRAVRRTPGLLGISHITGGGIEGNTRRLLRGDLKMRMDWNAWQLPPIFQFMQEFGQVTDEEMRKTFNLGIGLIFVVDKQAVDAVVNELKSVNENPILIGHIE